MSVSRRGGSKAGWPRSRKAVNRRAAAWKAFCKNNGLRKAYRISPEEMSALRRVALMGTVRSPRDFIFMLDIIRTSRRLAEET